MTPLSVPPSSSTPSELGSHGSNRSSWRLTILFLALGASGFLIERCTREDPLNVVTVDVSEINRLEELWESQAQRPPTPRELGGLVQEFVREEILVREALRLGLEQDDIIIRRRLAQKMSFLLDDTSEPDPPTLAELKNYFEDNADRFAEPKRTTFQHIFSAEAFSQQEVKQILGALATGEAWRGLGDPFMLRREYAERTDVEIDELFGQGFAARLASLSSNDWQPPVASALGSHIVRVQKRQEATSVTFEQVRSRVSDLYIDQERGAANRKAYQKVAEKYRVELPDGLSNVGTTAGEEQP